MSRRISWILSGLAGLVAATGLVQATWALGFEAFGPAGEHIGRSPDWPKGVEDVLRHPSRVYWYDVNGSQRAYYDGDVATINGLLKLYCQVDIATHEIVIRPGRPSAKSFHGVQTPYAVEFVLPGGIVLSHTKQYAGTGLVSLSPRLVLHLNEELAEQLDQLEIPDNANLMDRLYRTEDALAQIDAEDSSLRFRAVDALRQSGDASPAVVAALKRLAVDDASDNLRKSAETALRQIERDNDPASATLREKVDDFLQRHPKFRPILGPKEVLARLRLIDELYRRGFTASGTRVETGAAGDHTMSEWTITMGGDRLVFQRRSAERAGRRPDHGRIENTIYVSPERMSTVHRYRNWVDGELQETKPFVTNEPVGSTYDLLIGRLVWPLGREFTRRIDRVADVKRNPDGTLSVEAENEDGSLMQRWELEIDPTNDYLVRSAKAFRRDKKDPAYVVDSAGVFSADDRSTTHTARWIEGEFAQPVSIAVTSVSAEPDEKLIREVEEMLD